jgi:phage/plasmid-associated DNA primase
VEALTRIPLLRDFGPGGPGYEGPEAVRQQRKYPVAYRAAKHVYATEELTPLAAGDRFFERVLVAAFPEKLPAEDLVSKGTLRAERDGILKWAVEGLRRVAGADEFPSGRGPEETRRRWDSLSGPIGRLKAVLLEVTGDPQDVVRKDALYSKYREFCRKEGIFAETKETFTQTLTQDPKIEAKRRVPEPGADQVYSYVGVRWRRS